MKAETKHTPGPWTVGRTITGSAPNLVPRGVNGEGKMVYDAMIEAPAYFVAGVGGVGKEECLANANLIAAAPEMLSALEAVRESFVHIPGSVAGNKLRTQILTRCENVKTALNQALAAISKAKGSQ